MLRNAHGARRGGDTVPSPGGLATLEMHAADPSVDARLPDPVGVAGVDVGAERGDARAPRQRSVDPSLRAAFDAREPVADRTLARGARAWAAITAPKPLELQALATRDTPDLPPLRAALARHLLELPFVAGGTNFTERTVLALLADGAEHDLARLYPAFQEHEQRWWLTDAAFLVALERMAAGPDPLVRIAGAQRGVDGPLPGRARITTFGAHVHAGGTDWIGKAGIDRWVGGVHLKGREAAWRWDSLARAPRPMPAS